VPPHLHDDRSTGRLAKAPSRIARRSGYATTTVSPLGRRGAHTRDQIKANAADLFITNGYHATSVDSIARAVGGSRATIYQYFKSKEEIYVELVHECEQAVLDHGRNLGRLGPDEQGLHNLSQWLHDWADIYDTYAVVFLEFPGIGTFESLPVTDAGPVAEEFRAQITARLAGSGVTGMDPHDAAAAVTRISHMVNLYRYRGMFDLPSRSTTSDALAIALQLMLFPDTPATVIPSGPSPDGVHAGPAVPGRSAPGRAAASNAVVTSPVHEDVLSSSSTLFAEHGYYSVAMGDIAAAAEVSRATLYRYFNSKAKILAELTTRALLHCEHLAADLRRLSETDLDLDHLHIWVSQYVAFHRRYRGVIRAGFDGAVAEQLSEITLAGGIEGLRDAAASILDRTPLPEGIERKAATAVFLAILGRMTEPTPAQSDHDENRTAAMMVLILRRSLLRFAAVN
jgi:AcrR family transcriptional regulator